MRSIWTLVRKELRQNREMLVLLLVCQLLLMWVLRKTAEVGGDLVTYVAIIPTFLIFFTPLSLLGLSKRFFVSEYENHTHQFLDALPIERWKMLLTKYLLAVGVIGLSLLMLLSMVLNQAAKTEPLTSTFFWILVGRTIGYTLCLWGLCFLASFTGRFRNTVYFLSLLAVIALITWTHLPFDEVGPFALADSGSLPYQRELMPWKPFWQCILFWLTSTALGSVLALWRGGILIASLAGKMTLKEKSWAGLLILATMLLINVIDTPEHKEPLQFQGEHVVRQDSSKIEILYYEPSQKAAAEKLRSWLEPRYLSLGEEVFGESLPSLRVVLSLRLDGKTFETAPVAERDGVVIRGNYARTDFDRARFAAAAFHALLSLKAAGSGEFDPKHWFLDGISAWWASSEQPERHFEAAWLTRDQIVNEDLVGEWSLLADRYGTSNTESLAFSGLHLMEQEYGRAAIVTLAQSLYKRKVHKDSREALFQLTHPMGKLFARASGESYEQFLEKWDRALKNARANTFQSQLAELLSPQVSFEIEGDTLKYSLEFSAPPPAELRWSLSHARLKAFDELVAPEQLKREEHFWAEGKQRQEKTLEDSYSTGERFLVLIEIEHPSHRYPLQLRSQRLEIP